MQLSHIFDELNKRDATHLLGCGRCGIEKEGLRYTANNQLSQKPHPKSLGSPLTHKEITTDYAESLLEIVTPAFQNNKDTLAYLCYLHRVLSADSDEYILNGSMPAYIENAEAVEIGQYGESNAGKMRRLYRKGLALRHGSEMQLIAGMHFNYSICHDFFRYYADIFGSEFNQEFIDERYMNMVRNIRHYAWLTAYLFGHSPVLDKSFFHGEPHQLQSFDEETLYLPYATSLRMSDIGYQNETGNLVCANSLSEYVSNLKTAVLTPSKFYQQQGLRDKNGEYQQINTNSLQIENEYYTSARPKQITASGESPIKALYERGVAYVELRTLDVNCFERTGISQNQLDFLELYMLFCLFTDTPALSGQDEANAEKNMIKTACFGRDPNLKLTNGERQISIAQWGSELLNAMRPIAEAMDDKKHRPHYISIIKREIELVKNPELTPSARIIATLRGEESGKPMTYHKFITTLSQKHMRISQKAGVTSAERKKAARDAKISLDIEKKLVEKSKNTTFDQYLNNYFKQFTLF